MQGEPGILNTRPARLSFPRPEQPLDLDEQSQAFNADSARALTRSSVNGDIPRIYGDFAKQAGPDAHATLMDLAEQMDAQVGRDRTDQVMHGIVSQLPPDQAKALLGGTMPAVRPLGVRSADLPDDSAVPLFRAAEPVRLAQAETGTMSDAVPPTQLSAAAETPSSGHTQRKDGVQPDGSMHINIYPPPAPDEAPITVVGPNSGAAKGQKTLDPKYGDDTTPPEWKKDTLNAQGDAWKNFNTAVGKLSGVSDNEKFVYGQIYAAEGGDHIDPNSNASSGITPQTLEDARKAGAVPGLDKVQNPGDLSTDQRAGVMRWYFDKTMARAGGSAALDKINDKLAAGALADTLYRHGSSGGATLIQKAINRVNGNQNLKVDGGMGNDTLKAYSDLLSKPETRNKLLNELAEMRDRATEGKETARMDHYRPKP